MAKLEWRNAGEEWEADFRDARFVIRHTPCGTGMQLFCRFPKDHTYRTPLCYAPGDTALPTLKQAAKGWLPIVARKSIKKVMGVS